MTQSKDKNLKKIESLEFENGNLIALINWIGRWDHDQFTVHGEFALPEIIRRSIKSATGKDIKGEKL